MNKRLLTSCALLVTFGIPNVGFSLGACSTVVGTAKPTQFYTKKEANCTCSPSKDCQVSICRTLSSFKNKCDVSPSSLIPDLDQSRSGARLVQEE